MYGLIFNYNINVVVEYFECIKSYEIFVLNQTRKNHRMPIDIHKYMKQFILNLFFVYS